MNGSPFFQGSINQDPASVAYGACEKAKNEKYDFLIIDTAGRLSNNTNLLDQLKKIKSVINKSAFNFALKNLQNMNSGKAGEWVEEGIPPYCV